VFVYVLLVVVTKEVKYHSFLGCDGGWKGDCLWAVHKCLVIATLEDHDNPIESRFGGI
jgi:hypothetical protein